MLIGVLLVMGDRLKEQLTKAEANLGNAGRVLGPPPLAYLLVLRVVLTFGVFALDYVQEAMPLHPQRLRKVQRAVDRVLTRALRVPRTMPYTLLWIPLDRDEFGIPTSTPACACGTSAGPSAPWTPGP